MSDEPEKPEDDNDLPPSILSALGLSNFEREPLPPVIIPDNPDDDEIEMRKIAYRTLQKLERSLDMIIDVADNSQHPSAFEKVAMIGKTILDGAKDPLIITEKARKNKTILSTSDTPTIGSIHNNIIVADSADMFDAIKRSINKSKNIENE